MNVAKAFFDTNVMVYLWDPSEPQKSQTAQTLVRQAKSARAGAISTQVVQEFFQVLFRRKIETAPIEQEEVLHQVLSGMECVAATPALIGEALRLRQRYQLQWYDSLIVAAALAARCEILFSEDFQAGQIFEGTLLVVNPFVPYRS